MDGGGSGTRARLVDAHGRRLGEGRSGPSALGQGVPAAWAAIELAIDRAWTAAAAQGVSRAPRHDCALGIGVSGAAHEPWRVALLALAAGHAALAVDTDIRTGLLGAFGHRPGGMLSAGTGSFAACQDGEGRLRRTGGWGFPVGDEGSGAWLGLRAVRHLQWVLDGRAAPGPLSRAVLAAVRQGQQARGLCDDDGVTTLRSWCVAAGQHAYAALAPLVFDTAPQDPRAEALLADAAQALLAQVQPLDAGAAQPWVVAGSVAERLGAHWTASFAARVVAPAGDACDGALALVRAALETRGDDTPWVGR